MKTYQREFINFALEHGALRFGSFVLKSGRKSPYFFDIGRCNTGTALKKIGEFYAKAIVDNAISFDILFGPAYKGIPLVISTAIAMENCHKCDVKWCFNRKEVKSYGEKGILVGEKLSGKILVLDDVITAGTAITHTKKIIDENNSSMVGVLVALDRQECGISKESALAEARNKFNIPVLSIISFTNILEFIASNKKFKEHLTKVDLYRAEYASY